MSYTCARCSRPLSVPAFTEGPFSWGPKCAKIAGFAEQRFAQQIEQPEVDPRQLAFDLAPAEAKQGHKYEHQGEAVIAVEHGATPLVRPIEDGWLGSPRRVSAAELSCLPMKYFQGQVQA